MISFKLHPDNIEVFKTGWFNQNEVIGFVQSSTGSPLGTNVLVDHHLYMG